MEDITKISGYLAQNITYLRGNKNFSQQQLSELAGIPRTTLTNIESGFGNPSLANLVKIASALSVSVDELLSPPRSDCQLIPASKVPVELRSNKKLKIFKLLPDKLKGIAIDRMEFSPETTLKGRPHLPGTKEYMTVLKGEMDIYVADKWYTVMEGDVFAFPGNQPHTYRNPLTTPAVFISVIIPIPATSTKG